MVERPWQFLLAEGGAAAPPGWRCETLGRWVLVTEPRLPVTRLEDAAGTDLGRLLGWPVDPASGMVAGTHRLDTTAGGPGWRDALERALYRLGLGFLAVVGRGRPERVYLDPCGSVPAVFSAADRTVASTPALASPHASRRQSLAAALDIPARDHWYPFGLTPSHGVERLLPNHLLDLDGFTSRRHWPGGLPHHGVGEAAAIVGEVLAHQVASVAAGVPVQMSLTAGRDTRVLLAAAREVAGTVDFFTTPIPDRAGRVDVAVARSLAGAHGLTHRVLEYRTASSADLAAWQERTGHTTAGRTWRSVRTLRGLDPQRAWLPGLGGEVGRAYYWSDGAPPSVPGPAALTGRLKLPAHPEIVTAAERWLAGVPVSSPALVLDLLYVEQRLGCWASPQNLGHVSMAFRAFPFSHRRIFEAMLGLSEQARRSGALAHAVIDDRWPELLRFPFNEPGGLRGTAYRTARRVKRALRRRDP